MFKNKKEKEFKKSIHWYSKFERKLLCVLLLSSILPVIILGLSLYFVTINNMTETVKNASHNELVENMVNLDSLIDLIEQHYIGVVTSDEVNYLVENDVDNRDYASVLDFTEKIFSKFSLVEYFSGYTLINFDTDWTYSKYGIRSLSKLSNAQECIDIFEENNDSLFWINNSDKYDEDRTGVDLSYISLAYRLPFESNDKNALLIINLNRNTFESMLDNTGNISLIILDENGQKIYSPNEDIDNHIIKNIEENYYDLEENLEENNEITDVNYEIDGNKYNISFEQSDISDWTYITYYNEDLTKVEAQKILYIALIIALIVFIIILMVALFFTRWIYEPVKNIYINMRRYLAEEKLAKTDEFEVIEKGVYTLYSNNLEMESIIDKQSEQLEELFILRLLRGQLTEKMILNSMEKLKIMPEKYNSIVLINCSSKNENNELGYIEKDILYIQIAKSIPEFIRNELIVNPINNINDIILVVGSDNESLLDEKTINICSDVSKFILNNFGYNSKIGISNVFENLNMFTKAFHEATEALKRDGIKDEITQNELLYYSDTIHIDSTSVYNIFLESEISEAIDNGAEGEAFHITEVFIKEIKNMGLKWSEYSYFLHRYLISILLVGSDAGLSVNDIYESKDKTLFQKFNQLYILDEIENFYKYQIIRPLIETLKEYRKNNKNDILDDIVKLVEEKDGNITLSECAEIIECHPNTIWRIMKNYKNQTFSDYTAEVKLKKAEELLITTNMTINEIAELLSYTNAQNFIRYFKRHREMTPGKFRQKYSKK